MIKLPKGQEGNLHLFKSVSHSLGYVLEQFECIEYCQIGKANQNPAHTIK